jgi:transcriptional regulator with XRE-family HTH domain
MKKTQEKLLALSNGEVSTFLAEAKYRQKNRKWLRYSSKIAGRALAAIEEKEGLNQKTLAEQIGVTPQYVSKMLKGQENLSLETIAKLSEALGVELISFPEYKYSKAVQPKNYFVPATLYTFAAIKGVVKHSLIEKKETEVLIIGDTKTEYKPLSNDLMAFNEIVAEYLSAGNTTYAMSA